MSAVTVAVLATDTVRAAALAALAAPAALGGSGGGGVAVVTIDPEWTSAQQAALLVAHQVDTGSDVLVLATSHHGKEVAALAAHALGAGLLIDVHALARHDDGRLLGHKRELGGTWDVVCAATGPAVVLAKPSPDEADDVAWAPLSAATVAPARDVTVLERTAHAGDGRPALADAPMVVAGGRGLEGDLSPVLALADALGAAVGATRDIVEEGWIGHETMVGQTGTMISPRLYIGAGISGAPHHRLGMQASEIIVAINSDPDAPIMEIADFAVVGDAATVLNRAAAVIAERRAR